MMDPHPEPPTSLGSDLPIINLACEWFRSFDSVHGSSGAIYFGKSKFRFNAPGGLKGSFAVMYAARSINGMFIESFGRKHKRRVTQKLLESKSVAALESKGLSLVDITGRGLSQIGADGRLHTGDYKICQRWAAWIHRHPQVDGILYRSRHDPDCECAAIFDRAKAKITTKSVNSLDTRAGRLLVVPPIRYYNFKIRKSPKKGP